MTLDFESTPLPRLAEIVRWRSGRRPNLDDLDLDTEVSVNQPSKVKWKQKRVDSLVIAERSAKVRERHVAHQRVLDQERSYLDYLQYRAVKNVDNQMERIRTEFGGVASRVSLPLRLVQIPSLKDGSSSRAKIATSSAKGRVIKRPSAYEPYRNKPHTSIGIRLNEPSEEEKTPVAHKPPLDEKKSILGNLNTISRSTSVFALHSDKPKSAVFSRKTSISRRHRPMTAGPEVGRSERGPQAVAQYKHKLAVPGGLKPQWGPGSLTALNEYNKQKTTWTSSF